MGSAEKILSSIAAASARVVELKAAGKRVVFTNGAFDLLHVGHVRALQDAKSRGDILLIAVNSDLSVRGNKGPKRPIVPETERLEMLAALACTDYLVLFDDPNVSNLLEAIRPHVHAKGRDYTVETVPERPTALKLGIDIAIVGDPKDHSTTDILKRIREVEGIGRP